MKFLPTLLATAALLATAGAAQAQTKWDLPAAYPATNFHTENLVQFAADVDKATGGKLKITVHANASLFKAPEIKRAVQGGQAQIGEVLISNFQQRVADLRCRRPALPGRQLRRKRSSCGRPSAAASTRSWANRA
jgi:TRAP-type C4-dicarboxylate transport system substrate-binding protein